MMIVSGEEVLIEPRATSGDQEFSKQWQRIKDGVPGINN